MSKYIYDNLNFYFPFIVREAVEYIENGSFELIVKLTDGSFILYNDLERTIRKLPKDCKHMTEQECRKEFGIRLKNIMFQKSITQNELSEITGIQQYLISNYINGKTTPSFYNVDKIAKALNCSIEEFRYVL